MRLFRRHAILAGFVSILVFSSFGNVVAGKKKENQSASAGQLDEQKRALHALNRLTFGPRPGDLEQVLAIGIDKWIDQQLHPEKINDDAVESRLAPLRTLRMSTREMVENFPPQPLVKAVQDGKRSLPTDPVKRAIYEDQIQRVNAKKARQQPASAVNSGGGELIEDEVAHGRDARFSANAKVQELLDLPPDQRLKQVLQLPPEQRIAVANSLKGGQREEFLQGMTPEQRETLRALNNPQQVVMSELVEAKLLRATYSERQLDEVMTDFWFNHLNVFVGKGADRYLLTSYERDVIRPRALGKFEDLLVATAQSPAMLFYLDNWLSVGPNSDIANGVPENPSRKWRKRANRNATLKQGKRKRSGLNENYGRELMELHTLGVNGGYSQTDVTEVARVFTGWTLQQPKQGGGFRFDERMHEPGDKHVLGHRIKSHGEKEGLEVLHILAHHPATAKFVSAKLATRFVSDDPPASLVDRMAHTFLKKDGNIREVLKTMFQSPEFWSSGAYRAKVKTPLEFVVSSLRATGRDVEDAAPLARTLQQLGMPLYGAQPPTGYSTKADAWVNSSALLGRMNFALALTGGKMKGITQRSSRVAVDPARFIPEQSLSQVENSLLSGDVSQQTHNTIAAQLQVANSSSRNPSAAASVGMIEGLILGSPEFQRK